MLTLRTSVGIAAPPNRAWDVMSDTDRWHEWTPSITRVRRLRDAPLGVGTSVFVRQPRLPPVVWTVTKVVPGRSFEWTSRGLGFEIVAKHSVEPTEGGACATLSIDYHGPIGTFVAWLTRAITRRYLAFEANGLKARSENPQFRV